MNIMQVQIRTWNKTFGVPISDTPTIPSEEVKTLRKKLIEEEMLELFKGVEDDNLIEIADGLADLLYVVFGTAVAYGIDIEPVFEEVHRSNMSKMWPDGTVHRNEYGKVIKPPTYSRPNIKPILETL